MSYPRPFHGHIIHLYSALVTVNVSLLSFLSESRPCTTQRSQDSKARPLSSYIYSCAPSFSPTHHTLSSLFRPRTIQCGSPDKKAEAMAGRGQGKFRRTRRYRELILSYIHGSDDCTLEAWDLKAPLAFFFPRTWSSRQILCTSFK